MIAKSLPESQPMTKDRFIEIILDRKWSEVPSAMPPPTEAAPAGEVDWNDAFAAPAPAPVTGGGDEARGGKSFARELLEAAGFGHVESLSTESLIRGADASRKYLPAEAYYWPETTSRPYQTLLFELERSGLELLREPVFKEQQAQSLVEDAIDRLVQMALDGFERGSDSVTASTKRGPQNKTVCIVSVRDDRETGASHIVTFGSVITASDETLATFSIREECREWERGLAYKYLGALYGRHFSLLTTSAWQDAFITGEEYRKAEQLLKTCTGSKPSEKSIQKALLDLLDAVAVGFGLALVPNEKTHFQVSKLPKDHFIGVDADSLKVAENPFQGLIVRDVDQRLLGYIIYCVDSKESAGKLRKSFEENNKFHNVLVVYPDSLKASLQLWQGGEPREGKLVKKGAKLDGASRVVNVLSRFFVVSRSKIRDPEKLAEELACRARYLRKVALAHLAAEKKSGELRQLYDAFRVDLLHDISEEDFSDAFAQTLAYGLLAARWLSTGNKSAQSERFSRETAEGFIPRASPFLKKMFVKVFHAGLDFRLIWLMDDIADLLEHSDLAMIFSANDSKTSVTADPVLHFYEPFLKSYDADTRKDRGVYYTPDAIVNYMVRCVDNELKRTRSGAGLASSVTVLDPATGTGTFLKQTAEYIARTAIHDTKEPLADHWFSRLHGLEVMVAPYIVCHLRLSIFAEKQKVKFGRGDRIGVYLGDTLDFIDGAPRTSDMFKSHQEIADEVKLSRRIKKGHSVDVIIGNPPYKNNAAMTLAQVAERFPGLLKTSKDAARAQVRNIRDDYAWFFAAGHEMLRAGGVFCFVTSDSYLKKSSYARFREELVRNYDISSVTRLGSSIFKNVGPRIGFAVIVMTKRAQALADARHAGVLNYIDISGLSAGVPTKELATAKDPRLQWLQQRSLNVGGNPGNGVRITSVSPSENANFELLPFEEAGTPKSILHIVASKEEEHAGLFLKKWPGVITAFDKLLKADSKEALAAKMSRFFDLAYQKKSKGLSDFGIELGMDDDDLERLVFVAGRMTAGKVVYDKKRIRKTVSGTIPMSLRWAPDPDHVSFIYYEPKIEIPRNTNPGKEKGWGWMQQWREPATHDINPKLIFTTSTNRNYGFRAYVLDSSWICKLHGAASQQFHYVTLQNPAKPPRLDRMPNNLSDEGLMLYRRLQTLGCGDEDLLLYVASFYNSEYAATCIEEERGNALPVFGAEGVADATLLGVISNARKIRAAYMKAYEEERGVTPDAKVLEDTLNGLIASVVDGE